jgi:hypothetical protein
MNKPHSNIKQAIFSVTIVIFAAIIMESSLPVSYSLVFALKQEGTGPPPPPPPDCSIYTEDGRKIFVPCPSKASPLESNTADDNPLLSKDGNIAAEPLQTSPPSPSSSNSDALEQKDTSSENENSLRSNSPTPPECPKQGPIPPDCTMKPKF